jgi:hypothetical protein
VFVDGNEAAAEAQVLQVRRLQPRMFGNAREHVRADFFFVVECPDVIRILRFAVTKLDVGTGLREWHPTNSKECPIDAAGPGAGPLSHADWQVTLIDAGTFFDFSTSSAITRSASA